MELKIYEHKAQYYETDQMGIIHHANYLHWFEEARIDMMEQMGMGYDIMEKQGIISPVLSVHCDYKSMARFGETVQVLVQMKEYNGIRMTLEYTVFDKETLPAVYRRTASLTYRYSQTINYMLFCYIP